jgi:hypothetical protein
MAERNTNKDSPGTAIEVNDPRDVFEEERKALLNG